MTEIVAKTFGKRKLDKIELGEKFFWMVYSSFCWLHLSKHGFNPFQLKIQESLSKKSIPLGIFFD